MQRRVVNASAEIVNVQFGCASGCNNGTAATLQYEGAGVIGGSTDYWNLLTGGSGTSSPIDDAAGASTEIHVTWTSDNEFNVFSSSTAFGLPPATRTTGDLAELMDSLLVDHVGNTNDTITVTGLSPNTDYTMYVLSQSDSSLGATARNPTMTLRGGVGGSGGTTSSQTLGGTVGDTFVAGDNYALLTVDSGSTGEIKLTYAPLATQEADVNGFELVSDAPEPGTVGMALAGLSLAAAARLRRRGSALA